jgi:hypothetical protein
VLFLISQWWFARGWNRWGRLVVRRYRLRGVMAYFLPSLVCLIDNALKRLSEWHVEYDLGMDVRVAQVAKTRKKTVSKADVILIEFLNSLKVSFHTLSPSYFGKHCSLPESGQI